MAGLGTHKDHTTHQAELPVVLWDELEMFVAEYAE